MDIVFASGFETGDNSEWAGATSLVIQNSIKHSGNYAARAENSGGNSIAIATYARLSFWFYVASLPLEEDGWVEFIINEGTSWQVGAYVNSSGQVKLKHLTESGQTHYDSNFSISAGQWYKICITATNKGADYINSNRLYVDGSLVAWDNNDSYAYSVARRIGIPVIPSVAADFYYDDVVFDNTASIKDMGDLRVLRAGITGAGTYAEFDSYVGSANHFENIDELSPDDEDYNYDATNNPAKESYTLESCLAIGLDPTNVIKAVEIVARMKRGGGGSTVHNFLRRDNGEDVEESITGLGTSWGFYRHIDNTMPNSGGTWTQDRFDALEIGVSYNGGARDPYLSFIVAMIVFGFPSTDTTPPPQ